MLKNKIFLILLILVLAQPVYSEQQAVLEPYNPPGLESIETDVSNTTQESIDKEELPPLNNKEEKQNYYKQPTSKKMIAKKFVFAMLGVVISSLALFIILSLYNKLREVLLKAPQNKRQENELSLEVSNNLHDAIKTFLDKTNWNK